MKIDLPGERKDRPGGSGRIVARFFWALYACVESRDRVMLAY